ncbi:glucose-6-phosphate dehydrogenase [Pseudomonadales bacterium]|nr:glucose-6-phosphate dehydrogenase [Pseudomonadales bacterium]
MTAKINTELKTTIVIVGGNGDLALRKLLPALFGLDQRGLIDSVGKIIGTGRASLDRESYIALVDEKRKFFSGNSEKENAAIDTAWQKFIDRVDYCKLEADNSAQYDDLADMICIDGKRAPVTYYLSTVPALYGTICENLKSHDLATDDDQVVLEKPLGHNLETCNEIHAAVAKVFDESKTFRIDHYLGKETVQNLLTLRFSNALFNPLWNNRYIDNVQITVAESIGVAGRAAFYGKTGALRDMVQNHLLQILSMVAMEPPSKLNADAIRNEKVKVLEALTPITSDTVRDNVVRGQYSEGAVDSEAVVGFLQEDDYKGTSSSSNEFSNTETFVALKAEVHNWRWAGVPFYLRTGKRLRRRYSEIVIEFKRQPFSLFEDDPNDFANKMVITIQPEENIRLHTLHKEPGLSGKLKLQPVALDLSNDSEDGSQSYDAYERLLLDIVNGDQTLFMRSDEVEAAWRWTDSIISSWTDVGLKVKPYASGTMGPTKSLALPERDDRSWHES